MPLVDESQLALVVATPVSAAGSTAPPPSRRDVPGYSPVLPDAGGATTYSERLIPFIEGWESWSPIPYDRDGLDNATIGYGHLLHLGPVTAADRRRWGTITRAEGLQILRQDIQNRALGPIRALITHPLTQIQFDATVDFVFNIGEGNLLQSSFLPDVNAGRFDLIPNDIRKWVTDGKGHVLDGLVKRRNAEVSIWLHGIYDSRH